MASLVLATQERTAGITGILAGTLPAVTGQFSQVSLEAITGDMSGILAALTSQMQGNVLIQGTMTGFLAPLIGLLSQAASGEKDKTHKVNGDFSLRKHLQQTSLKQEELLLAKAVLRRL